MSQERPYDPSQYPQGEKGPSVGHYTSRGSTRGAANNRRELSVLKIIYHIGDSLVGLVRRV